MNEAVMLDRVSVVAEGDRLLSEVSLSLPAGRVIGLLGPSGAGKTTLMRVIVGLRRVTSGRAEVFGLPTGHRRLRAQIGYATQSQSVYADLTVAENLAYFGAMVNAPRERIAGVLKEVSLEEHADHLVRRLSGGQRVRVSLAIAMLGQPKLLVLDEPTVGLDPLLRTQLWDHFHALAAAGTTLLVSSHVMDEAERCDDLVLIREGRVVAYDTPAKIKRQTKADNIEAAFIHLIGGAA